MKEVSKSTLQKIIFELASKYKMRDVNNGVVRHTSFVDQLFFKKIRDSFGGRLKFMITGGAPLGENVLNFARATLGCVVVEGYGQTEAVACASIT